MLGEDHCPSEGNPLADVMIVGLQPKEMDVDKESPLNGPSGEVLEFMLQEAGLERSEVYVANVLKCMPPGKRKAMEGELDICQGIWLKREIKAVDPQVILILGKDAFMALLPESKHDKWGHLATIKSKKRTYLATFHPSWFLKRNKFEDFVVQVGQALIPLLEDDRE
jgi:DNA polymerase